MSASRGPNGRPESKSNEGGEYCSPNARNGHPQSKSNEGGEYCSANARNGHPESRSTLRGSICSFSAVRLGAGWAEVERLAARQRSTIHRHQMRAAAVSNKAIAPRVRHGDLVVLFPDVFLVARLAAEPLTRASAALLYCRGDGLLSHLIAGYLWGILDEMPAEIDVTLAGRGAGRQAGLRIHRVSTLDTADHALRQGLDVTSVARTLVDLAGCVTPIELESALAIALRRRLTRASEIHAAIARTRFSRGVPMLRALLGSGQPLAETRSRYERKLLSMLRSADLPDPETNVRFEGYLADLVWRELRVVGEMDGFGVHGERRQFETDRARGGRLVAADCRLVRVTARQIDDSPHAVVAWFAAAIALARAERTRTDASAERARTDARAPLPRADPRRPERSRSVS